MFYIIDLDDQKSITKEQFHRFIIKLYPDMSESTDVLWKLIDVNRDGVIEEEEFLSIFKDLFMAPNSLSR